MSKVGVHLIIEGRVQGVGFRYFCQQKAISNSINGEVKNLPDGNVEVVAEADEVDMNRFINTIQYEHPFAHVSNIKKIFTDYTGMYKNFKIKY